LLTFFKLKKTIYMRGWFCIKSLSLWVFKFKFSSISMYSIFYKSSCRLLPRSPGYHKTYFFSMTLITTFTTTSNTYIQNFACILFNPIHLIVTNWNTFFLKLSIQYLILHVLYFIIFKYYVLTKIIKLSN